MTAKLTMALRLWCDGKACRGKFRGTHPQLVEGSTVEEITRKQHRLGWTKQGNADLCPECTAIHAGTPAAV